jgi:3-(3-hydroxy-phenyl)propionate hydroxylase
MTRGIDTIFEYKTPHGIKTGEIEKVPVIIVGAGPVGLTAALDLALHGIKSILLDDDDRLSSGSRAICWAKRTLEIMDRLGVGDRLVEKGVTWKVGRLFHRDEEVYSFDLLPETGHKMPAFINLPQWGLEHALVRRLHDFPGLADLRWKNRVIDVHQTEESVTAVIETPEGNYQLRSDYLLACDGVHSSVRKILSLDFEGEAFEERFLIADIVMEADFPSERWFWFDPVFNRGHCALLHKQPDNLYRLDFGLGDGADYEAEKDPANVSRRVEAMLPGRKFALDWISVYSFQCRRLKSFVQDRVIFAGDAAHIVSVFGARGGNSGIQDVDNLVWKLAAVLRGEAPPSLLETYNEERIPAADENALITSRTARFMSPRTKMEKTLQRAVLDLAGTKPFARKLVNSGRLSTPHALNSYSLQTPSTLGDGAAPGMPCPDAPLQDKWLLNKLGNQFCVLTCGFTPDKKLQNIKHVAINETDEVALIRYGKGMTYLIRPDQHIAAKVSTYDECQIQTAHERALGRST